MAGFVVKKPFRQAVAVFEGVFVEAGVDYVSSGTFSRGDLLREGHGFGGNDVDV
jgi:hypothetical protein